MDETWPNHIFLDSTRMSIHEIVRELKSNLGTTAVQTMAGVKDRTSPIKWAKHDGPQPRPEVETRMRLGDRVWKTIEQAEGRNVALAWLMGANPRLNEERPILCIQQNLALNVIGSAEAFLNDVASS